MFFIEPALPKLRASPPLGDVWIHEVKFDGYRIQLHKTLSTVSLYSKGGSDFRRKCPELAEAVAALPVRSCVIDGELTACDASGIPDFRALHFNSRDDVRCVWAFDLLHLNGKDLRPLHRVTGGGHPPPVPTGRVEDWRAGLGRCLCSLLPRPFGCEVRGRRPATVANTITASAIPTISST